MEQRPPKPETPPLTDRLRPLTPLGITHLGLGMIGVGVVTLTLAIRLYLLRWRAVRHGQVVQATITSVTQFPGKHDKYLTTIHCSWTAPDGATHSFRSATRLCLGKISISNPPNQTAAVWVDPAQPTNYWVDDSTLLPHALHSLRSYFIT
ncbi:MAG: DUF3592 domain-containing protein [Propionibacteriaceae bacterium]|nr:DUF3592 domain-containing protein [Propionibacteriaceae bacterium]